MASRHESIRHLQDRELESQGRGKITLEYMPIGAGMVSSSNWYATNYGGHNYAVKEISQGVYPTEEDIGKVRQEIYGKLQKDPNKFVTATIEYEMSKKPRSRRTLARK